jgi:DNA-binding transcriptional MerR regulator
MNKSVHISEAAKALGVTPHYLRLLEWQGRIPEARRDYNGRIYTPFDVAMLRSMGVRSRPARLISPEEIEQCTHHEVERLAPHPREVKSPAADPSERGVEDGNQVKGHSAYGCIIPD